MSPFPQNPFNHLASQDPSAFYGRHKELKRIWGKLRSQPPNCTAIIGETSFGKTSLLRYLTNSKATLKDQLRTSAFIFVYLDASPYIDLAVGDQASVQFWWDMYRELQIKLDLDIRLELYPPRASKGQNAVDQALEIKSNLEELIKGQDYTVIFALDNVEGVASLPLRDSAWLRSLARYNNCAYLATSRHLLKLLYHPDNWSEPSPLWNLFLDPIYLGLMEEEEVMNFILQKGQLKNFWGEDDIKFIRSISGRHPELIRLACAHVYECHQQTHHPLTDEDYKFLDSWIYRDATPMCSLLWHGLANPGPMRVTKRTGSQKEPWSLSLQQKTLVDVAKELDNLDLVTLGELEQRGLVERVHGKWRVFANVMRQFVLRQELAWNIDELSIFPSITSPDNTTVAQIGDTDAAKPASTKQSPGEVSHTQTITTPAFTYLEGRVYEYLQARAGQVCDKNDIKQAIWGNKSPTDSTLQKIIERIRRKIEPDPDNPRHLIAVRGHGYILREGRLDSLAV